MCEYGHTSTCMHPGQALVKDGLAAICSTMWRMIEQLHSHANNAGCRLAYDGVTKPSGSLEIEAQHHCKKRHIERSAANAG